MQKRLIIAVLVAFTLAACCKHPVQVKVEPPAPPMGLWDGPIHKGLEKWMMTGIDCGGFRTADCQCWAKDASDCEGEEICHWCPMDEIFEWAETDVDMHWKVWFDAGSGLSMFHSATHKWSDIPDSPGVQIILVCEKPPYRRMVHGADWYWWGKDGPVAGTQTATASRLPRPQGKKGLKQGLTIPDRVYNNYHQAAFKDKTCSAL